MSTIVGNLRKMKAQLAEPVRYQLSLAEHDIHLNELLGHSIHLEYLGEIHCIQCGRKTKKSFEQGHCYPCMLRLQECNCILYPERCRVEEGNCATDDWAHQQCDQAHVVYLANSSGLKVGITRETQVPFRWIDQGAVQAMPILKTKNRYQAGLVEVALKKFVADRTQWQTMLKGVITPLDLIAACQQLFAQAEIDLQKIMTQFAADAVSVHEAAAIVNLQYPVHEYPKKITGLSFDKTLIISGTLLGIKGQYLILDGGVVNIRKFSGYRVRFTF